jgi:hypothetical protein
MPRGSRPRERRGGRQRGTPNRRTVLAERILVVAAERPTASRQALLRRIALDREVPPDTRMAIAERLAPGKGGRGGARRTDRRVEEMSQAALFAIVQDADAAPKGRRKAAAKLATHLAPMKPANKRWRFDADDCGFAINAEIAKEYRELDFELRKFSGRPNRAFPTIAKMIRKLEAKRAEIVARLECPAPELYGAAQIWNDRLHLEDYACKREDGIALTAAEDADEAHRKARFDCYVEGPEQTARRHRMQLEMAEINFRKGRLFKDGIYAPPLSRKQRDDLSLLRVLYPPPHGTTPEAETEEDRLRRKDFDEERARGHPFHDEEPAVDGNFYPRDSKLRPPEPEILDEFAYVPPYSYFKPGVGPVFGYDPDVDPKTDTSFRPLNPPAE